MIARLSGKVVALELERIIIDVGGVGYDVAVSAATRGGVSTGDSVTMDIHTHVTETDIRLFGFSEGREKALFLRLIGVSGIGPKLAMTILSGISAEELATAIASSNTGRLEQISGIGKKTAERIVVELRDRLKQELGKKGAASPLSPASAGAAPNAISDAIAALVHLGYHRNEAQGAIDAVVTASGGEIPDGVTVVRQALRHLGPRLA